MADELALATPGGCAGPGCVRSCIPWVCTSSRWFPVSTPLRGQVGLGYGALNEVGAGYPDRVLRNGSWIDRMPAQVSAGRVFPWAVYAYCSGARRGSWCLAAPCLVRWWWGIE